MDIEYCEMLSYMQYRYAHLGVFSYFADVLFIFMGAYLSTINTHSAIQQTAPLQKRPIDLIVN